MSDNIENPTILFETSWEVCNKVGGIYTVLSTKAKILCKQLGNNMIFVGPDVWTKENPSPFFKESKTLLKEWRNQANLPDGISVRIGKWLIPGSPVAILVKFDALYARKNEIYAEMWERYQVDSLHAYGDYDEGCAFAVAAAMVIRSCAAFIARRNDKIVAHFNEWTTGMGLLYLKTYAPNIATVFTTHATSIGRSICGNNKPLYKYFHNYNGDQMAAELNMQSKHSLEKAAAHNADCFTTVSKVTANECEQLLEIRPFITPNGFELAFVPKRKEYDSVRKKARDKLLDVASALTGKSFSKNTFLFATAGRNEYRNKGIDMFIDAVNTLHNENPARAAIAFILVPAWSMSPRADLQSRLQNATKQSDALPEPVITHTLHNYSSDTIYNRIEYLGLLNGAQSNVNVIYVPCYLNGNDGIFDMTYYELLPGFDAAVFPSYYEPWGYTPQEGLAFGVPTIATDLSGFGQWLLSEFENDFNVCGAKVVHRTDSNYETAVSDIVSCIKELMSAKSAQVKRISGAAIETSKKSTWEQFIEYYRAAYDIALKNKQKQKQ
ncbi:MAG TPA: glycogen/starch synthase [Candidatus Limisoma intestinavium]|uniref:Glycogen/starch synthase n=1 Tax=Candidatus Limisoma intestinavium TaxID=2840856 RepID=A0A9D1LFS5_9BACT|nr:glycogen/starch synthase [Candidatus Limisoma intestinavium]